MEYSDMTKRTKEEYADFLLKFSSNLFLVFKAKSWTATC